MAIKSSDASIPVTSQPSLASASDKKPPVNLIEV